MQALFHIALVRDWDAARAAGAYTRSTRGASLDDVGYIHLSFAEQVEATGERYYADAGEAVVVLVVDPSKVGSEVRVEDAPGTGLAYPHLYGPLPIDAVVDVCEVDTGSGRFRVVWPPSSGPAAATMTS